MVSLTTLTPFCFAINMAFGISLGFLIKSLLFEFISFKNRSKYSRMAIGTQVHGGECDNPKDGISEVLESQSHEIKISRRARSC